MRRKLRPEELLQRAGRLARSARSDEALELLAGCERWPVPHSERGIVLCAHILRFRDPIAALELLPESADAFTTHDGRVRYLLESAQGYMALRNLRAAQSHADAAAMEIGENDPHRYLLAYVRAKLQWDRRDYDPDSPDLALALESPDAALRLDALNLRAWMYWGVEDYRAQLRELAGCLRESERCAGTVRAYTVAGSLHSAAMFAWELFDRQAGRRAARAYEALVWTPELERFRFFALRGLAWLAFLEGDAGRAGGLLEEAQREPPGASHAVLLHADRASMAAMSLDADSSEKHLLQARRIADEVSWQRAGEERIGLIVLASLLAHTEPDAAQRYVDVYHRLRPHGMAENVAASHEPRRVLAYQKYADGRVQAVLGKTALAARLLGDAHYIFASIAHVFRAALCAQAVYEITHERAWLERARAHAQAFPDSPLAKRLNHPSAI